MTPKMIHNGGFKMDRRDFLKTALAVSGAVAIGSVEGLAEAQTYLDGIIYTKDKPGMWKGKEGSHAPVLEINGNKVKVTTKHVMSEPHYIVRHTLVAADGTVLGSKTFKPTDKEAVSTYELPSGYKGKLYATSFCNAHDLWVSEINL